jgi:hypothetical protein
MVYRIRGEQLVVRFCERHSYRFQYRIAPIFAQQRKSARSILRSLRRLMNRPFAHLKVSYDVSLEQSS